MHKAADESIGKKCNANRKRKKNGIEDQLIRELMTLRNKLIRDRNIKNAKVVGKNIMVLRKNIS